jgi:PAS domain-containing protein/two-component sensor histidine kinase
VTAEGLDDVGALRSRVERLEDERRRVFAESQREADAMFAQYQLSQLLASGDELEKLAAAVLAEIARTSGATWAALWLASPGETTLRRTAVLLEASGRLPPPVAFPSIDAAAAWAAARGASGVPLEESRALGTGAAGRVPIGFVAVGSTATGPEASLDPGHMRYLGLVRRELALAFRSAQLRGALARERGTLAAILDGASDAIIAVGPDQRITRLNRAASRLVGGTTREGVGSPCWSFLGCLPGRQPPTFEAGAADEPGAGSRHPPSGPDSASHPSARSCGPTCPFEDVLEHGRTVVREHEVRGAGGHSIPVAGSYSAMASDPAGPQGVVGVLRDLRAGRELDELKRSFVATVSHELRTPLALISGHSQSLLHLSLDAETSRRHLERIADAVERLGALVDEIIDVSRLESDQLVLERAPTDLCALLDSFSAEAAELPGSPRVRVECASLPPVDIDAPRVRQVLSNLLSNAHKYAGDRASVLIRARQQGGTSVLVTFADDGQGILPEDRARVFDRFHRGLGVRESAVAGSGLGLYICRRLVEAHGGWIRLDGTRRGTSITFRLPVATR